MAGTMALSMCFMPSRPWKAESGSKEMASMAGLYSLRRAAVPTKVPLVPSPATKCVTSVRLLPDLRRRRFVVRARVGRVGVLVRIEVAFGVCGVEPPRLTDGPVRALVRIGQHEVDAVGAQDLLSLLAGILRHTEFHPVAERGADPS